MKNKKALYIGGAIAAVATGMFLIFRKKKTALAGTGIVPDPGTVGTSPTNTVSGIKFPLKNRSGYNGGADKTAVKNLQRNLNMKIAIKPYLGLQKLTVDGMFGPKTEAACRKILGVGEVSYSLYKELIDETEQKIKMQEGTFLSGLTFGYF